VIDNSSVKFVGITEVSVLMRWVRSVAGSTYRVEFVNGAETAYVTEDKRMVIPHPNEKMTLRDAIRLRGFCLHETSHPRYQPDIFKVLTKSGVAKDSPLLSIYNMIADVHAETMRFKEWPGDGKALSEFAAVLGHDVTEKMEASLKDTGGVWPRNFKKVAGLLAAMRSAEGLWNVGMVVGFNRLINDIYTQEMRDIGTDLEAKFNFKRRLVEECEKEDEWTLWELAKEVYEYLYDKPSEDEQNKGDGKGEGKGEPKEGKGGAKPQPGEGDGEGEKSTAESNPSPSNEQDKDQPESDAEVLAKEKIKVTDLLMSSHYETKAGGGHGMGFDYTGYKRYHMYQPVDPSTFYITDYKHGKR
jgi:hypothetical protein